MIDSLLNLLFRCPHRRLTRPITPMHKPNTPQGETYVVCLDCGKQFTYDWEHMHVGKPVELSETSGVLHHNMPKAPNTRLKYAMLGSALPLAVLLGKALTSKRRDKPDKPAGDSRKERKEAEDAKD
jgi:hypothetical protein